MERMQEEWPEQMVWMGAAHSGRLEVDKVSRDRMRMYPGGLVGGLGLIQRRVRQRRQRINQSVYLSNQSPAVHKVALWTYEDNDTISILCPTFGHLLILVLRKF
jgi:hypothetical protein